MNDMKYRKPKIPDFPIIIDRLVKDGMSLVEISECIKCNKTTIYHIKSENRDVPPSWLQSYYLLDLYIRKFDLPIPFFGEHNE